MLIRSSHQKKNNLKDKSTEKNKKLKLNKILQEQKQPEVHWVLSNESLTVFDISSIKIKNKLFMKFIGVLGFWG